MQTQKESTDYYNDFYKNNDWKSNPLLTRLKLVVYIKIVQSFYKKEFKTVLDAGCGKGLYASLLNNLSYKVKCFSPFNTRDFKSSTQIFNHWRELLTEDGVICAISRTNFTGASPTGWIFLNEESIDKLYGDTKLRKKIVYLFSPFWVFIYLLPKSKYVTLLLSAISKYVVAKLFKIPVTVIILLQNE